ncbi:uncharacterized protein K452DRAFT_218771 [Aplosporella prunicola CBS 121167]|uniref:Uncharacterized protein n=1 Tax=Aplosporella prunicola CBS 121167 TaxID=1176127 RepID=A0A6A6BT61_9PEZI|nr:uncharacterized protein K452DRAFT_218771 [Aplosporella prunicola CBS 121167]KAF2146434.1 hypothetical protein K452DRAFT_218771 [Aplosporella prunicola CBS 121167]
MVQLILRENPSILGIRASFDEEETTSKAEPILCYAVEGGLEMVRHFLEAGVDVNEFVDNVGGRTALQRASEIGKLDIVELLLKEGADINAAPAGFGGVTALQAAAIESNLNVARRLLEEGADVNVQGTMFGLTVLEEAARQGRIDMVQLLLDNGADITSGDFGDVQYENAVNIAREEGHIPVVWMLEKHRKSLG